MNLWIFVAIEFTFVFEWSDDGKRMLGTSRQKCEKFMLFRPVELSAPKSIGVTTLIDFYDILVSIST